MKVELKLDGEVYIAYTTEPIKANSDFIKVFCPNPPVNGYVLASSVRLFSKKMKFEP